MVGMSGERGAADDSGRDQLRYARALDIGMKAGLGLLTAGFLAYVAGVLPPHLAFDDLNRLWVLPVGEFLRQSGTEPGWGWLALLGRGDMLALGGVALLAGISLACLALLLPAYARRRDWSYLAITACLVGVLALAASGVIVPH
jgi:hypothetical protein